VLSFLGYALAGKVLIYLFQKSPYSSIIRWGLLKELFDCSLCLGVWVYFILAILLDINLFLEVIKYNNITEYFLYFITGAVTSFLVWVFSAGWDALFSVMEIK